MQLKYRGSLHFDMQDAYIYRSKNCWINMYSLILPFYYQFATILLCMLMISS
jgi:hypothetical protein